RSSTLLPLFTSSTTPENSPQQMVSTMMATVEERERRVLEKLQLQLMEEREARRKLEKKHAALERELQSFREMWTEWTQHTRWGNFATSSTPMDFEKQRNWGWEGYDDFSRQRSSDKRFPKYSEV